MRYIVWDWNGTLFDDVQVCIDVMNGMLKKRGVPGLTPQRYRDIFGFPVEGYYRAAGLDLEREPFTELAQEYIAEYNRRALSCGLRPGAETALRALRDSGYAQIIASASERRALENQVRHCGVTEYFEAILGIGDILAVTKAGLAREYLRSKGIPTGDVTFIGDTGHDWQIAHELGCRCLLAAGGHESRARLESTGCTILSSLTELLSAI